MNRKHRTLITIVAIVTTIYMVYSAFYMRALGYANITGHLNSFLLWDNIARWTILSFVGICGLVAIRDQMKKTVPFYLVFFMMNLVIPTFFR